MKKIIVMLVALFAMFCNGIVLATKNSDNQNIIIFNEDVQLRIIDIYLETVAVDGPCEPYNTDHGPWHLIYERGNSYIYNFTFVTNDIILNLHAPGNNIFSQYNLDLASFEENKDLYSVGINSKSEIMSYDKFKELNNAPYQLDEYTYTCIYNIRSLVDMLYNSGSSVIIGSAGNPYLYVNQLTQCPALDLYYDMNALECVASAVEYANHDTMSFSIETYSFISKQRFIFKNINDSWLDVFDNTYQDQNFLYIEQYNNSKDKKHYEYDLYFKNRNIETYTNIVYKTIDVTNTVTSTIYNISNIVNTSTVFVTNSVFNVSNVVNVVDRYVTNTIDVLNVITDRVESVSYVTNTVISSITNYFDISSADNIRNSNVGSASRVLELEVGFTGEKTIKYSSLVYDKYGFACGIASVSTAAKTAKGVRVSGSIYLDSGKNYTIASTFGTINNGILNVSPKCGAIGTGNFKVGSNGVQGTVGEYEIVPAKLNTDSGLLKGSITLRYLDSSNTVKSRVIKLTGMAIDGEMLIDAVDKNNQKSIYAEVVE